MKIALYIEDGLEQIVLTPTSDTEKALLGKMHDGSRELSIKRGTFYACQGGWIRQRDEINSSIIVLRAIVDRSPEGQDRNGLDRNDESDGSGTEIANTSGGPSL